MKRIKISKISVAMSSKFGARTYLMCYVILDDVFSFRNRNKKSEYLFKQDCFLIVSIGQVVSYK